MKRTGNRSRETGTADENGPRPDARRLVVLVVRESGGGARGGHTWGRFAEEAITGRVDVVGGGAVSRGN